MISAHQLDIWDRCERRFAFERDWASKSITPFRLLHIALEAALPAADPEVAAQQATMSTASEMELQLTDINAFMAIRHVGFLAGILAVALRRRLGEISRVPTDGVWESALWQAGGRRHKIELVSHLDDDRLRQSAHSWSVVGELVALEGPITLTHVVIGAQRGGRRHSAWTKGLLHPTNHALRFARRKGQKGSGFNDGWEEVWREHRGEISTEKWLGVMEADGVLGELIVSREIGYKASDFRMISARREMDLIQERMASASTAEPMRRSACDDQIKGACPFQPVCYAPVETSPERLVHLYSERGSSTKQAI